MHWFLLPQLACSSKINILKLEEKLHFQRIKFKFQLTDVRHILSSISANILCYTEVILTNLNCANQPIYTDVKLASYFLYEISMLSLLFFLIAHIYLIVQKHIYVKSIRNAKLTTNMTLSVCDVLALQKHCDKQGSY